MGAEKSYSPNETIGIGVIGAGGRGGELSRAFAAIRGAKVVAVADPDSKRAGDLAGKYDATAYSDLRKLIEDPQVDAVAIATCNHWHCLAAIMAMQAGKDVYVEKPLSHSQWEGRQVVEAAAKYERIVQVGTQQRSDPMQAEIKAFLHEEQALGPIQYAQANRLGVRQPIGRREQPLAPPSNIAYDLWLGPAAEQPIFRDSLHYDWHWDWNTGNGEMGNWGVHVLDDVRNVAYRDSVTTPRRILAAGGRVAWDDAGQTPNVHYALFETDSFPTLIALSNLSAGPKAPKKNWQTQAGRPVEGPDTGYVVACEGGYYLGQRGRGKAVDKQGKTIREFKAGDMVRLHVQNFLDAVRSQDPSGLNADAETGHHSTGWCNLANIGFLAGKSESSAAAGQAALREVQTAGDVWPLLLEEVDQQLQPFGRSLADLQISPMLEHNPETERFEGEHADSANRFLKRTYRAPYAFPEIV
ncbi:Gfo/Idh/MocA family protein [Candidatus Laterigemmans baculatus]|uniref:Gfo/Idh/MocA family protein n=1 Tax=Candidatus Laterigemmans baculatus TaxID=2770505 RepID=UPI0013DB62E1|nr:Gfo/Idh/MocA family oxidoreductase [Candidatus Laterigemmans baculatus]